ncbi:MAG: GDP-mannose 4,6-dehydratase [Bacteroidetes bacterium]|nr:GDP-mannose 4,6-dehydratase [Bacteroidota bacterium]
MSKVLITGCAGFIGTHLTKRFLNAGHIVYGIDNLSRKGSEINLDWIWALESSSSNFHFYQNDIRNYEKICTIFKTDDPFDLIIHEAAQVAVTTSVLNPREDFEINALGTFNMLEATRIYSLGACFIFASTNKVYGGMKSLEVTEQNSRYEYKSLPKGVDEIFPLDFHSPYGCSKGAADQYVRDYHRIYNLNTVVLRQSCIYGTQQYGVEDQGWVAWFTIASILEKQITIYGDGMQIRDILWIDDLVDLYYSIFVKRDLVSGEVFNVGGGPENTLSILELVSLLKNDGILKRPLNYDNWRPGDQKVFVGSIEKIHSLIGWSPKTNPVEGVKKLIGWVTDNKVLLKKILG